MARKPFGFKSKDFRLVIATCDGKKVKMVAVFWNTSTRWADNQMLTPLGVPFIALLDVETRQFCIDPGEWDDPLRRAAHYQLLKDPGAYTHPSVVIALSKDEVEAMQSLWPEKS